MIVGPPVALDRKKNSSIRFNAYSRHMEPSSTTGNLLEIQGSLFDAPEGAALIRTFLYPANVKVKADGKQMHVTAVAPGERE